MDTISSIEILWGLDSVRGGIAAAVPILSDAMCSDAQVAANIVGLVPDGQSRASLRQIGQHTYTLPSGRLRWLCESRLQRELEQLAAGASVMHIHGLWQEHVIAAAVIARRLNLPVIISAHGMLDKRALRAKRWKKLLYSVLVEHRYLAHACALRALTRSEVDDYRGFGLKAPAFIVPNGVTIPDYIDTQRFLNRFPQLANRRLIMYLGRLHSHKGIDLLTRAWSRIERSFPDAHLVFAGPDEANTQAGLNQLARRLGIGSRITFTGMLGQDLKWDALAAAEVFVLPSHSEGFSVAVLEAMACSRPVILTRQCNFPEVALHQAGLIIEPDERQIERALIDVLRLRASERAAMGARGFELVKSKYTWASAAGAMAEVYEWLCGGSLPQNVEIHYA